MNTESTGATNTADTRIPECVTRHMTLILGQWDAFARPPGAVTGKMFAQGLRDDARQTLEFVAADIETAATAEHAHARS